MRKPMLRISKFAPLALALAAAFLFAGEARAQRRCSQDPAITGRTCPEAVCIALQDAVDAACKNPPPLACRRISGCEPLKAMRAKWESCRDARITINVTCWGGGDPGHQSRIDDANLNIANCDARIALPQPEGCADPCP